MNFSNYLTKKYIPPFDNREFTINRRNIGLIYFDVPISTADYFRKDHRFAVKGVHQVGNIKAVLLRHRRDQLPSKSLDIVVDDKIYSPYIYQSEILNADKWTIEIENNLGINGEFKHHIVKSIYVAKKGLTTYSYGGNDGYLASLIPFEHQGSFCDMEGNPDSDLGDQCVIILPDNYLNYYKPYSDRVTLRRIGCDHPTEEKVMKIDMLYNIKNKTNKHPSEAGDTYRIMIGNDYRVLEPNELNPITDQETIDDLKNANNYDINEIEKYLISSNNHSKDERLKIVNHERHNPRQSYPSHVMDLIKGTQILVLQGDPKCGKTALAYHLLDNCKHAIGFIGEDERDIPGTIYTIIDNVCELNTEMINRIIGDSEETKVIITTQEDLSDDQEEIYQLNRIPRFVNIAKKLYDENLIYKYETCSFP